MGKKWAWQRVAAIFAIEGPWAPAASAVSALDRWTPRHNSAAAESVSIIYENYFNPEFKQRRC